MLDHCRVLCATILLAILPLFAEGRSKRSAAEVIAFKQHNPCPATGLTYGRCPGWEVDHPDPLCSGGRDHRDNMQWLKVAEHRAKTRDDVMVCRYLRLYRLNVR